MNENDFKWLNAGDVVRHRLEHQALVVVANYGDHVIAVRVVEITNPNEWNLLYKADMIKINRADE